MIMDVSEVLKALADPNRLRILNLLHEQTLCVCDLEAILDLNQSNLSRHLSKLKQAGIVKARKKALFTYYSRGACRIPTVESSMTCARQSTLTPSGRRIGPA